MLNPTEIQALLLRAQAYHAQMTRENAVKEYAGDLNVNWRKLTQFNELIQAMIFCYYIQDYSSDQALAIYGNLIQCVGSRFSSGVNIDPEAQPPGNITFQTNFGAYGYVETAKIYFNNATLVEILNWQTTYAADYGQNPDIRIYTDQGGVFQKDEQTQPVYDYATPGDSSTPLQRISFTYPALAPASGYYIISGIAPGIASSGGGGGGGGGGGSNNFLIYAGDSGISTDGSNNFVFTSGKLSGKTGYYIYVSQNNQFLFDGVGIQSNPAGNSFTILNSPGFTLLDQYPIIVNLN